MCSKNRFRPVVWAFLLWVAVVPSSRAEIGDEIARDFRPLSGYVIMPAEGEFLIDRGAEDGIVVGDLFSVVQPGERIVHPVTGKELGTLERLKGILMVTRVRPRYSHARPIEVGETVGKGDAVRRFDRVSADFVDSTGGGRPLYDRLRILLPSLEWRYVPAPTAGDGALTAGKGLTFMLANGKLQVRGPEQVLRSYDVPERREGAPPIPPAAAAGPMESAGKVPAGEFVLLGEVQGATLMADFVRDGDRLLLAATDGNRIDVYAVGKPPVRLGGGVPPRSGRVLGLHWWKPLPDGAPMLAATVAVEENQPLGPTTGNTVVGVVFIFRNDRLSLISEELPYLLGSFDRDGDGNRETLLGQSFDRDIFFGDRIREIRLKDGRPITGDPSFPIPRTFAVQGAAFIDLTGDGRPETVVIRGRKMFVYDESDLLYESSQQMGGSLSVLTYDLNPGAQHRQFTTAAFEVSPSIVDMNGNGRREAVAVASEGSGALGLGSGVRKSWLSTLEYREGRFVRGALGRELETPLQGLYSTRDGIYVVTTEPRSLRGKKKASQLLFLPVRKQ